MNVKSDKKTIHNGKQVRGRSRKWLGHILRISPNVNLITHWPPKANVRGEARRDMRKNHKEGKGEIGRLQLEKLVGKVLMDILSMRET